MPLGVVSEMAKCIKRCSYMCVVFAKSRLPGAVIIWCYCYKSRNYNSNPGLRREGVWGQVAAILTQDSSNGSRDYCVFWTVKMSGYGELAFNSSSLKTSPCILTFPIQLGTANVNILIIMLDIFMYSNILIIKTCRLFPCIRWTDGDLNQYKQHSFCTLNWRDNP